MSSAHATATAIEAIAVSKTLPFEGQSLTILQDINLQIANSEFVALVGPSGSGKSTLLGLIAGLDTPTSGQISIGGTDITHMGETQLAAIRNRTVGMVFQAYNLIPTLTAQENVEVPLYVRRRPERPVQRAHHCLELVGLASRARHKPNQLSGGEQQRVAIARALVIDPAIVIMDEPTGNLDRHNGDAVLDLLRALRQQTGTTFVIATHDPTIAAAADRAIHIIDGRIA